MDCYSSTTYGYAAGNASTDVIDRFSFSSDGNATDWADLNYSPGRATGTSSETHGFTYSLHTLHILFTCFLCFTYMNSIGNLMDCNKPKGNQWFP